MPGSRFKRSGQLRRLVVSNHNRNHNIIVSIAQKPMEARGRQRCFLVVQRYFCPCFANKPNIMADFNRTANLVACYLLIFSILWRRLTSFKFHEDTASRPELDGTDFLFFRYRPFAVRTFLFSPSAASMP